MAQDSSNEVLQISAASNGTKTLLTSGKYCDRNIEVNVNVPIPDGYIKPTGSKSITSNGTHDVTSVASAVVNVPQKATQFTNLYDPANVVLKTVSNCSSGTASFSSDSYVNYVKIPFHHKAKETVAIRARGISTPVRDRQNFTVFGADGTTVVSWGQFGSSINVSYDEYGDVVMTLKSGAAYTNNEWYWIYLNFQYQGVNSGASTAKTGPIITINEPIGNGGYAG